MKIAKYTLYVDIYDGDEITTEALQEYIDSMVLSQCALNGHCLLIEEKSRIVDTDNMTGDEIDSRPTNLLSEWQKPETWERTIDAKQGWL